MVGRVPKVGGMPEKRREIFEEHPLKEEAKKITGIAQKNLFPEVITTVPPLKAHHATKETELHTFIEKANEKK